MFIEPRPPSGGVHVLAVWQDSPHSVLVLRAPSYDGAIIRDSVRLEKAHTSAASAHVLCFSRTVLVEQGALSENTYHIYGVQCFPSGRDWRFISRGCPKFKKGRGSA